MFAASKSKAASGVVPDQYFDYVTALLNTTGTNGAQNNTFIDSSTSAATITRNGNATQGSFSPYGENWSNFFDGTGDFLTVASSAAFGFGTGDFTIEFWVFPLASTRQDWIDIGNGTQRVLVYYSGSSIGLYSNPPNSQVITGPAITLSAWAHIALSKQGGNTRLFVNGTQVGSTYTTNQNYGTAASVTIGKDPAGATHITGYMSNVRVVKGTALYTTTFTPSTTPLQPIAGTSLLTCKDPNLVDDSANQFTITRNGDVSVQKFAPFAATTLNTPYYGGYFDGTGDYLSLATNAAFGFGTGEFTIECWFNTQVIPPSAGDYLFDMRTVSSQAALLAYIAPSAALEVVVNGVPVITGGTVVVSSWNHFALAKSGTTTRMFLNGVQVGSSYTDNVNYVSTAPVFIGSRFTAEDFYQGHISNFRIVKGQALYTANFTPSTVPLTTTSQGATASNVSLLTLQSNTFIDNSTNNFAITAVGNSRPTTFAPFALTYSSQQSYTPAVYGGSAYFDGTGDYLSVPTSSFLPASNTYTIEMWIRPTAYPGGSNYASLYQITNSNTSSFGGFLLTLYASGTIRFDCRPGNGGTNVLISSSSTVPLNAWSHVALSVNAGAATMYINGASVGTGAVVVLDNTQLHCSVGYLNNGFTSAQTAFAGHISGLRVLKGTALYPSAFAPFNAPPTPITNTTLLLNGTNAGIYDAATLSDFETVGNAQVSTGAAKYGTSSIRLDGTGDYLSVINPVLALGNGNFTVECWVNYVAATNSGIFQIGASLFPGVSGIAVGQGTSSDWLFYYGNGSQTGGGSMTTATWYHVAVVRNSGTTKLYINGTQLFSVTDTTNYTGTVLGVGGIYSTAYLMNGYLQDLRITRGIARYTTNFTPPTAALPTF